MTALAAIVGLLLQDAEVERLVRELDDDAISVRERAADRLVSLGERARAAVERAAKEGDAELGARARRVLGEIALAAQRDRVLGPAWKVSVPEGLHTLGELATDLRRQAGVALELPPALAGRQVRIAAKEALIWDFLSELCRADGGVRLAQGQPADAFALEAGAPSTAPASVSGPFRVRLERLRLERRQLFDRTFEEGSMLLAVDWQPNVKPIVDFFSKAKIQVDEIRGDDGKVLPVDPDRDDRPYSGMSLGPSVPRSSRRYLTFEMPARGVRRLAVVRGSAEVVLPLKVVEVAFEKPLDAAGQTRKAGDYEITLRHCERRGDGIEAVVGFEAPVEEGEEAKSQQRVEIRSRIGAIHLADEGGRTVSGQRPRSAHRSGTDAAGQRTEGHELGLKFPPDAPVSALRISFIADYFVRRVEFEFRDVELP